MDSGRLNFAILSGMSRSKALITGITGQDGSYLAQDLLSEGYSVIGTRAKSSSSSTWRLRTLGVEDNSNLEIIDLDITDPIKTSEAIKELKPSEVYNLASHSFVADSLFNPQQTTLVSGYAPINLMEAISSFSPETRFFQAGSSEMFGTSLSAPQNEQSDFYPRNIYGSAKVFAHSAALNYRQNKGLFAASGILYNHESPLRGNEFVTKKITAKVAKIKLNQADVLSIGNLSSVRDWGYAPEYVQAMRMIMSYAIPDTFVIASGKSTTVRDFVRQSFSAADMEIVFEGSGLEEVGYEKRTGRVLVSIDSEFYRESETVDLVGDASKAKAILGWSPKTPVAEIANLMVKHDLETLLAEKR
jgi:GDPmannose 4,6-dehydratase